MKTFLNLKQPQAFTALMTFVFGGVVSMMAGCMASADNRCIGMDDSCAKEKTSNDKTQVKNVLETPLAMCSQTPLTGWFRDGYCKTDANDHGRHLVCARMTETFLTFTKGRGNDLSTPKPRYRFPGLKPGDQWCLCALRWREAHEAGKAPPVVLEATHKGTLKWTPIAQLKSAAHPAALESHSKKKATRGESSR